MTQLQKLQSTVESLSECGVQGATEPMKHTLTQYRHESSIEDEEEASSLFFDCRL